MVTLDGKTIVVFTIGHVNQILKDMKKLEDHLSNI